MGRPKGSKNKSTLIKMGLTKEGDTIVPVVDNRTDKEIVDTIIERFNIFYKMVVAASQNVITALVTSGSAGVGKTHTTRWVLEGQRDTRGTRFKLINGAASALGLYESAYEYRHPTDVIVLDDADRVFDDEDTLNILKVLLDTSRERRVSWMTDHPLFKGESALPREFVYNGAMVFLTNKDFQSYIDTGKGRWVEHMEALMSRSIYLDLKMHTRREVALWAAHIVTKNGILQDAPLGLSAAQEKMAVDWVISHQNDLRELSIRTVLKLGTFMKMDSKSWERVAAVTLLRDPSQLVVTTK